MAATTTYQIPAGTDPCEACGGTGEPCDTCYGWGYVDDDPQDLVFSIDEMFDTREELAGER